MRREKNPQKGWQRESKMQPRQKRGQEANHITSRTNGSSFATDRKRPSPSTTKKRTLGLVEGADTEAADAVEAAVTTISSVSAAHSCSSAMLFACPGIGSLAGSFEFRRETKAGESTVCVCE